MASRNVTVNVIGDSRSLERAFDRSTRASQRFGRDVTGNLARVDKGFTRFQRLAAGGFIGGAAFAAAATGLRAIVRAAQDSEESLGQTRVALESTGKSWERYGETIQKAVASQSRLGFDDEALLRTFSLFVRQTDDVGQALRENNIAMDVARARFIDLEQAAQIVNKAALGQAGALRRIGIDAKNGASGVELLAQLEREFGGSAEDASKRSTAAFDRLRVSLENIEETIGTAATPALAEFANAAADAADDIDVLVAGLGRLGNVKIPAIHIPFAFDVPGGGSTTGNIAGQISKFLVKETVATTLPGVFIAHEVIKHFQDDVDEQTRKETPQAARAIGVTFSNFIDNVLISAGAQIKPTVTFGDLLQNVLAGTINAGSLVGAIQKALGLAKTQVAQAIQAEKKGLADQKREAEAAKIQDQFAALISNLQLGVDRAGLTRRLDDDLRALNALKAGLERQVKAGVDVTDAQSQLVTVAQAIADKQDEIRQRAAQAFQASQFRALGLSATGDEIVPGANNLATRINQTLRNVDLGKVDISSKLITRLRAARRLIKTEGGKLTEDTRRVINDFIKAATGEDNQKSKGPLTKTSALNVGRILDGLGLSRDDEKELRSRLSSFNSAGLSLGGKTSTTGRFATGQPVIVESHTTITLDGDVVGRAITRSQQKAARRNPPQRRGPNAR